MSGASAKKNALRPFPEQDFKISRVGGQGYDGYWPIVASMRSELLEGSEHTYHTILDRAAGMLGTPSGEWNEIKPTFVRDMRQKAPHVFKMV